MPMTDANEFLTRHGATALFAAVFLEQAGVPLPAAPLLLLAGSWAGSGRMHLGAALSLSVAACLLADAIWYFLGRYGGSRVPAFLCRFSLVPNSCVRSAQNVITRYGLPGIAAAKFIPGLSTMAPPLAGSFGITAPRFFFFDAIGSLLYTGAFILLGFVFRNQLERILEYIERVGRGLLLPTALLIAAYVAFKYWQRKRALAHLRVARATPEELRRMQEANEPLIILDVRSRREVERDGTLIRGAFHLDLEEVNERHGEIPRDRDVFLYCSCPDEETAARVALLLQGKGVKRVRPLLGGIAAWRERDFPLDTLPSNPAPNSFPLV
jgi:membrane protein DedA with SNARE-associated domain/rhodanese-related sulfurtransferase